LREFLLSMNNRRKMGKVGKQRARDLLGKTKIAKDSGDEEDLQCVSSGRCRTGAKIRAPAQRARARKLDMEAQRDVPLDPKLDYVCGCRMLMDLATGYCRP